MSTITPPPARGVPVRPGVPSRAPLTPPGTPVAQQAPATAPVAEVTQPVAAQSAPVAQQAPVTAATEPAQAKEKKPRKQRTAPAPYTPTLVVVQAQDGSYVYATKTNRFGKVVYDRKKLEAVPALSTKSPPDQGDSGYDPETMEPLTPRMFSKLGDYWRFKALLAQTELNKANKNAELADSGQLKQRAPSAAAEKLTNLLAVLASRLGEDSDAYKAIMSEIESSAK